MSNLMNPKPRFAFDPTANRIFDYATSRDVELTEAYVAKDGIWNLLEVKALILAGEPIEAARVAGPSAAAPAPVRSRKSAIICCSGFR